MSALHPQENDNLNIVHLEILVRQNLGRAESWRTRWKGERKVVPTLLLVGDLDMAASASQFLHRRVTH